MTTNPSESLALAIDLVGGIQSLSRQLSVSRQSVYEWMRAASKASAGEAWTGSPVQISVERAVEIERLLSGAVTAEQLRPDKAEHFAYLRGSRRG